MYFCSYFIIHLFDLRTINSFFFFLYMQYITRFSQYMNQHLELLATSTTRITQADNTTLKASLRQMNLIFSLYFFFFFFLVFILHL